MVKMSSRGIKQVQESRRKKGPFFIGNDLEKIIEHSQPQARR